MKINIYNKNENFVLGIYNKFVRNFDMLKKKFLSNKTWEIIDYFLKTIKNYYYFFLKGNSESKILKISAKYGNFFHRSIIFSNIGNEFFYILKNPKICFLLIYISKFLKLKILKLINQFLKFYIEKFFFLRGSLIILDFYYQSIACSSEKQFLTFNQIFPLNWINQFSIENNFNTRGSVRLGLSGFSPRVLKYIKHFHLKYFYNLGQVFFILSSKTVQGIIWEFFRCKKKRFFSKKILKKSCFIFPTCNYFPLIFFFFTRQNQFNFLNQLKKLRNKKMKIFSIWYRFLFFLMSFSRNKIQTNNKFFFICKIYKYIFIKNKKFSFRFFFYFLSKKKIFKNFLLSKNLKKKGNAISEKNFSNKKIFVIFLIICLEKITKKNFLLFFLQSCFQNIKIFRKSIALTYKNNFNLIFKKFFLDQKKLNFNNNLKLIFLFSLSFIKKKNFEKSIFQFLFFQISLNFIMYIFKNITEKILFFLFYYEKFFINAKLKKIYSSNFFFRPSKIKYFMVFSKKFLFFLNLETFNLEN